MVLKLISGQEQIITSNQKEMQYVRTAKKGSM